MDNPSISAVWSGKCVCHRVCKHRSRLSLSTLSSSLQRHPAVRPRTAGSPENQAGRCFPLWIISWSALLHDKSFYVCFCCRCVSHIIHAKTTHTPATSMQSVCTWAWHLRFCLSVCALWDLLATAFCVVKTLIWMAGQTTDYPASRMQPITVKRYTNERNVIGWLYCIVLYCIIFHWTELWLAAG